MWGPKRGIYKSNDNCGWTKNDNINGWNEKNIKILRNDWKKDLLVVDMVIIKHILEWGNLWDKPVICRRDHRCGAIAAAGEHE